MLETKSEESLQLPSPWNATLTVPFKKVRLANCKMGGHGMETQGQVPATCDDPRPSWAFQPRRPSNRMHCSESKRHQQGTSEPTSQSTRNVLFLSHWVWGVAYYTGIDNWHRWIENQRPIHFRPALSNRYVGQAIFVFVNFLIIVLKKVRWGTSLWSTPKAGAWYGN